MLLMLEFQRSAEEKVSTNLINISSNIVSAGVTLKLFLNVG
jgi:hypothetical protein